MSFYKKNEFGRTMLEMLSVLVIFSVITVLSVLGYRKMTNRVEADTITESILKHVVQRRHEALTKKGFLENSVTKDGPHGVQFEIKNDTTNHQIVITTKMGDDDLKSALMVNKNLKAQSSSISSGGASGTYATSVVAKFDQFPKAVALPTCSVGSLYASGPNSVLASDGTSQCKCESGQIFNSGSCLTDKCANITLDFCQESCNSVSGIITNKQDDFICDYDDSDTDTNDGSCSSGACIKNTKFKYMRLHWTATKEGSYVSNTRYFQISELKLIDENEDSWNYPSGTTASLSGCTNMSGEGIYNLIDGRTDTKLCGYPTSSPYNCYASFVFPNAVDVSVYNRWQWYTANDTATFYTRNLKNFELQFSRDGSNWITADSQSNYTSAPSANETVAYTGDISI